MIPRDTNGLDENNDTSADGGIPEFSSVVTPVVTLTTLVVMRLLIRHRRILDLQKGALDPSQRASPEQGQ